MWHLPVTDDDVFCLCSIGSYNQDDIPMVNNSIDV